MRFACMRYCTVMTPWLMAAETMRFSMVSVVPSTFTGRSMA